ncbi:hypothetical protein RJ639_028464 [Escallonia herrerae]|uniref:COX assembly mitochondrial protein n=1 Tax=Escallonia herrerae TaxID=1293975 RepID=A0AA89BEY8_9ASTE|nr:hypothetical protein RJ639_028464 [Escallonia herrerae]
MSRAHGESLTVPIRCERLHAALRQCHSRVPAGPPREAACRHLNRSLAGCLVAEVCPEESDAVRTLCSSGGTGLRRSQCHQAQLSLLLDDKRYRLVE